MITGDCSFRKQITRACILFVCLFLTNNFKVTLFHCIYFHFPLPANFIALPFTETHWMTLLEGFRRRLDCSAFERLGVWLAISSKPETDTTQLIHLATCSFLLETVALARDSGIRKIETVEISQLIGCSMSIANENSHLVPTYDIESRYL